MKTQEEILKIAHKSLFKTRKKIDGDVTISRDGTINRYEGGTGSTFAKQYDERILFQIAEMSNAPLSVFEAWKNLKDMILNDNSLREFLKLI